MTKAIKEEETDYTLCPNCKLYSYAYHYCENCNWTDIKESHSALQPKVTNFKQLLRALSITTEYYREVAETIKQKYNSVTPLLIQEVLKKDNMKPDYSITMVIFSLCIGETLKMSSEDKSVYVELFKLYVTHHIGKQINYPLLIGYIYYLLHGSTILIPQHVKRTSVLDNFNEEWSSFLQYLGHMQITKNKLVQQYLSPLCEKHYYVDIPELNTVPKERL